MKEAWDTIIAVQEIRDMASGIYPSGSYHKLVLARIPDDEYDRYEFHIQKLPKEGEIGDIIIGQIFYVNSETGEIRIQRMMSLKSNDTSTLALDEWIKL